MKNILNKKELLGKKVRRSTEKLKYIEKKAALNTLQEGLQGIKSDRDFSVLPEKTRQMLGLNDFGEVVRNCRIVSDEYVRELMKKYGREIRRG